MLVQMQVRDFFSLCIWIWMGLVLASNGTINTVLSWNSLFGTSMSMTDQEWSVIDIRLRVGLAKMVVADWIRVYAVIWDKALKFSFCVLNVL